MSFNSTMVRLKGSSFTAHQRHKPKFQFHNGSIKSSIIINGQETMIKFQFHNGSIKS